MAGRTLCAVAVRRLSTNAGKLVGWAERGGGGTTRQIGEREGMSGLEDVHQRCERLFPSESDLPRMLPYPGTVICLICLVGQ